jgi:enterochelin esterase-like enzyme
MSYVFFGPWIREDTMRTTSSASRLVWTIAFLSCLQVSTGREAIAQSAEGVPAPSNIGQSGYPRILPDNRVVFQVRAPRAAQVQVNLGRMYDMQKDESGIWTVTTTPQDPGFHYYSLVIDGVRVADPASQTYYGSGWMSSGIEIPEAGVDFYMVKNVPHGDIRLKRYFSKRTNTWRPFYVYTPPGYDTDVQKRYPVLYIQHGAGEDERCWGNQGHLDAIMDNLIAAGKAKPMLVVMTNEYIINEMGGSYNTEPFNRFMDLFKDELFDTIIPFVESNYRALSDRENRAIAGLSMGGGFAFRIGMLSTDKFAWIGVFSSSAFRGQGNDIFDAEGQIPGIFTHPEKFNKSLKLLYISTGEQDRSVDYTKKAVSTFREKGLKVESATFPGAHEWHVWRKALNDFAPRIFK